MLGKRIGAIGARATARLLLRSGAEEVIGLVSDKAMDALGEFDALDGIVKGPGEGMSKAAGQLIATQMAAEKVRRDELPQQLDALRKALLQGQDTERVVALVDELDRCHPDYALAFLEAMKPIFDQSGFVFCLMVNTDYLERLANHQFDSPTNDEKYLDKFVDIRLALTGCSHQLRVARFCTDCTLSPFETTPNQIQREFGCQNPSAVTQFVTQARNGAKDANRISS